MRSGLKPFGVYMRKGLEVLKDPGELCGERLDLGGLQGDARKASDMEDIVWRERHEKRVHLQSLYRPRSPL